MNVIRLAKDTVYSTQWETAYTRYIQLYKSLEDREVYNKLQTARVDATVKGLRLMDFYYGTSLLDQWKQINDITAEQCDLLIDRIRVSLNTNEAFDYILSVI